MSDNIPRLENCGRYLACNNKGEWFYINHGGTWQTFQGSDAANAAGYKARADEAERLLEGARTALEAIEAKLHAANRPTMTKGLRIECRDIARAFLSGAKPQPDPLLIEARNFIRDDYENLLMVACPVVDGVPVRERCDDSSKSFIEEYETLLAKMDEALK